MRGIQARNKFASPPKYSDRTDVYELVVALRTWRRAQESRGFQIPDQLFHNSVWLDVFEQSASILEWWSGSSEGDLDFDDVSDHLGPSESEQGRITRAEHARQRVPLNAPEQLDWRHVLLLGFIAVQRHLGAKPPALEAHLLHAIKFRQTPPGAVDLAIPREDALAFMTRWQRHLRKLQLAIGVHGNLGVTLNTSSTRQCMEALCKQLDDFLGPLVDTARGSQRRYMDPVYSYLQEAADLQWNRLGELLTHVWTTRLTHESRQLTAQAHAAYEYTHTGGTPLANLILTASMPPAAALTAGRSRASRAGATPAPSTPPYVTPAPGYGLHDGCLWHPHSNHTNRGCMHGPAASLTDAELRAYLTNLRNNTAALTNAADADTAPLPLETEVPPPVDVTVNATGAQLRNRQVVEARTASMGRSHTAPPQAPTPIAPPSPVTPAEVLQDGSTACCNREKCLGKERCWWLNPHLIQNLDRWEARYTNEDLYGAERAEFTRQVAAAARAKRPPPSLAAFRQQHPELRGTSSHLRPHNTAYSHVAANVEVAVEGDYDCAPLTEDLLEHDH